MLNLCLTTNIKVHLLKILISTLTMYLMEKNLKEYFCDIEAGEVFINKTSKLQTIRQHILKLIESKLMISRYYIQN